jgi:hypothetical protein
MTQCQCNSGLVRVDVWGPAAGGGGAVGEMRTVGVIAQVGTADLTLLVLNGMWWSIT